MAPASPKTATNDEFSKCLRAALALKNKVSACRLEIMSLKKIKGLVPDTQIFAETLHTLILEIIKRRLGPKDAFIRINKDTYLIIFENLDQEDAELECVLIIEEVLRSLFKDRHLDDKVDIRTVTIGLDGKVQVDTVDLLEVIRHLLDSEAGRTGKSSSGKKETKDAVKTEDKKTRDPEPVNLIFHALPSDLHFVYQPIWNMKRKVFSMYSCIVTDGKKKGYDVLGHDPDLYLIPALDFLVFNRVMHELKRLREAKISLLLLCPVHIDTLCDPRSWPTYHALCHRLLRLQQRDKIIFEIYGVNEDTDPAILSHALGKLTNYCRYTILRTVYPFSAFVFPAECKMRYFSVDIASFAEPQKRKLMNQYVLAAHVFQKEAIITNLQSPSQVMSAASAGFIKASGEAIHSAVMHPDFIFQSERHSFLDQLRGEEKYTVLSK